MEFNLRKSQPSRPVPMPIIVGSPRSGTTLLRFMLDAHPQLAIPPETGFLALGAQLATQGGTWREHFHDAITTYPEDAPGWNDFGIPAELFRQRLAESQPFSVSDGFRMFYRMYADRFGKPRFGDKTPLYCRQLRSIEALLPEAHFIHIVRDGRDAAVSLRTRFFSPGHEIDTQAHYWRENVLSAREQGAKCSHYMELRYEDLLREPEAVLRRICEFIELNFDPAMLRYYEYAPARLQEHSTRLRVDGSVVITREERVRQQALTTQPPDLTRIGSGRLSLSHQECNRFNEIAGDLLRSLGYLDRID